jgi:hypothetical protein
MIARVRVNHTAARSAADSAHLRRGLTLASGVFNTSQQVGGALGLAVLPAIASAVTANASTTNRAAALVSGYTTAFAVAAGITLAAVIVVVAFLPVRRVPASPGARLDP